MRRFNGLMMASLGLSIALTSAALAKERSDKPIPERRQAWMLEQFGDEGIDTNGDDVLTRDEVRTFREEKGFGPADGGFGRHGRRGGGRGGPGFGPGGPMGHMLRALDRLQEETPTPWFTIDNFPDADTDGDGQLSTAEWQSFSTEHRAEVLEHLMTVAPGADGDKDGALSEAELIALRDGHMARMREQILLMHPEADTDNDGSISDAEFEAVKAERRARILERHPQADLNGDGALSEDEMESAMVMRHRRGAGPKDGRGFGRHGMGGPPTPEQILERHPEADTDADGTLNEEELATWRESCADGPGHGPGFGKGRGFGGHGKGGPPTAVQILERHPEADTDGDGALSEEELATWRESCPRGPGHGRGRGGPGR